MKFKPSIKMRKKVIKVTLNVVWLVVLDVLV